MISDPNSATVTVVAGERVHQRPTSAIVGTARAFESSVTLTCRDHEADAKMFLRLLGLIMEQGDSVTVTATGPDATEAADAVARQVESGTDPRTPPEQPGEAELWSRKRELQAAARQLRGDLVEAALRGETLDAERLIELATLRSRCAIIGEAYLKASRRSASDDSHDAS